MISKGRWQRLGKFYSISFYDSEGDVINPTLHSDDIRTEAVYASVPYLSFGDYCGSLVEKSNIQAVENDYDRDGLDYINVGCGSYGHKAIALSLVGLAYATTKEVLDGLESYPIYNEDHYSELETNAAYQAWLDDGHEDFIREYGEYLTGWPKLSKSKSWQLWGKITEEHNSGEQYSNQQGDDIYFDIKCLIKRHWVDEQSVLDGFMDELYPSYVCPLHYCSVDTNVYPFIQLEVLAA